MKKYTLARFLQDFATNAQCLEHIKNERWPSGIPCEACGKVTNHYLIADRKCFSCQNCGTQVYPTAGTIFHKSSTPLTVWFYVIYQMSQTRTGVAAKQIERETGVTYKTAWRMCQLVRACLDEKRDPITGVAEADESYFGGNPRYNIKRKRGRGTTKTPVFGIVERGGAVTAKVVRNVKRETLVPIIEEKVAKGAKVYTDELNVYNVLSERGYEHERVKHKEKQYVRTTEDGEKIHTNTLEGFWSQPKNAIRGVHRGVAPRYLNRYLDEYTFRYSHSKDSEPMFLTVLSRAACSEKHDAMLP